MNVSITVSCEIALAIDKTPVNAKASINERAISIPLEVKRRKKSVTNNFQDLSLTLNGAIKFGTETAQRRRQRFVVFGFWKPNVKYSLSQFVGVINDGYRS